MWVLVIFLFSAHHQVTEHRWLFTSRSACDAASEPFQDDDRYVVDCHIEKIPSERT